ncbi:MAG: hypothetical protein AB7S26_13275 [Sandaracinaceae bacterium]
MPAADDLNAALAERLAPHRSTIAQLPPAPEREHLLVDAFRVFAEGALEIYYAPIGFVVGAARLAIVGITPGWTQMQTAFAVARAELLAGRAEVDVLREAKRQAAFRGSMRTNLIAMLDEIGVARAFDLSTTRELFDAPGDRLHTTSALRLPVFRDGENYTGSQPRVAKHHELTRIARTDLAEELSAVPRALVLPLGKAAEEAVGIASEATVGLRDRVLRDFPHPSGANGHRKRLFEENKGKLSAAVERWAAHAT